MLLYQQKRRFRHLGIKASASALAASTNRPRLAVGCYRFGFLGATCEERGNWAFIPRCGGRLSRLYRRSAARPRPLWCAFGVFYLLVPSADRIGMCPGGTRTQSFGLGGLRGRRFWEVKQPDTEWDKDASTRSGSTLKSGSRRPSLAPDPLRTMRAPFTAHGASKSGWSVYYECLTATLLLPLLCQNPPTPRQPPFGLGMSGCCHLALSSEL